MADGILTATAQLGDIAARAGRAGVLPTRYPDNAVLLSAPFAFGVDTDDFIRVRMWGVAVRSWSSAERTFTVAVRMVELDGRAKLTTRTIVAPADLSRAEINFTLEPGAIQTLSMYWDGGTINTLNGPLYAVVDLLRGTPDAAKTVIGTFIAGYTGPGLPLTWPGSPILGPSEGPGYYQAFNFVGANNSEFHLTFNTPGEYRRLRSVYAELVTSLAAGNRRPRLTFDVNLDRVGPFTSPQDIPAGTTCGCTWTPGASLTADATSLQGTAPLAAGIILRYGDSMDTDTFNRQANDKYARFDVSWDLYLETLP